MPETFKFHVPIEIIEKATPGGQTRRVIGGICSTDDLDSQSEVLLQDGLDFGPFLEKGWFNDNHDKATGGAVGVPVKAELRLLKGGKKGWYVEGDLLGNARGNDIWDLAQSLERSDTGRKLGFSVEGQITERDPDDPSKIRKAVVREVAITRCPVNVNTELNCLAKSLSAGGVGGEPGQMGPLQVESLEGAAAMRPSPKDKKKKRLYTKSEAVERLQGINSDLSSARATQIVEYALRHYPPHNGGHNA